MNDYRKDPDELLRKIQHEEEAKTRGHLKIFLGYAAGVGKTYAMLESAHDARARGIDVIAGYIEPHARPQTAALLNGLEVLPTIEYTHNGLTLREFDLDGAIKRKPELVLVDEFAHTNAPGCRHTKRYQDIQELLASGIDVYTTVNVQHIESLHDIVASITGIAVQERIPDSVFDQADQIELIDIEPEELLGRLKDGKIYAPNQASKAMQNFFTVNHLAALREIALRRCADQVNRVSEMNNIEDPNDYYTDEHILVGLSSSPSNAKIIRTAARMAYAFRGTFTALYVETSDFPNMKEDDKKRLDANTRLARQLGADIETVYGDDIPFQIAEYARLSNVSKIVIGRSATSSKHLFGKPTLTEELITTAPNLDIHIIPDAIASKSHFKKTQHVEKNLFLSVNDIGKSIGILAATSALGYLFQYLGFAESNIITVYVLAVLIISIVTVSHVYSFFASVVSVLVFNFLFTDPKFSLEAYDQGYPVTFAVMFIAAFLTGTLATKLKTSAKQSARAAYRTKILFDMNQALQKADTTDEIIRITASHLLKLLNKNIIFYPSEGDHLKDPIQFTLDNEPLSEAYTSRDERAVAIWTFKNNKCSGATTQTLSNAKSLYLAIRVKHLVYGVVGIVIDNKPIDPFENSILLSMLGECALALENKKNAEEKEAAAILAKNEQLQANLLRAISHDLRTPLTSISGNASNLLSNGFSFDDETKKQLYTDIYDDSMWLINLVENLLSVTRLEQGRLNLNIGEDLISDVIDEALRHINRRSVEHHIKVYHEDDLLLAKMDARLIIQVIINIVDNAIKYTPVDSTITISTRKEGDLAVVSIADDGSGISDEMKPHIFDMFYSGTKKIVDSHRSLGLGLSLCRSIINVHNGTISVSDNTPNGTVFTFTLPAGEVELHE